VLSSANVVCASALVPAVARTALRRVGFFMVPLGLTASRVRSVSGRPGRRKSPRASGPKSCAHPRHFGQDDKYSPRPRQLMSADWEGAVAADSKLRGCDVVAMRVADVTPTATRSIEQRSARRRPVVRSGSISPSRPVKPSTSISD
jgi:hypothetical protein